MGTTRAVPGQCDHPTLKQSVNFGKSNNTIHLKPPLYFLPLGLVLWAWKGRVCIAPKNVYVFRLLASFDYFQPLQVSFPVHTIVSAAKCFSY